LSTSYDLTTDTTLKASWGIYRELPRGDELDPQFGNENLVAARSKSSVLGVEHHFDGGRSVRLEAYDKALDWIPVSDPVQHYVNNGVGTARGFEVFARQAPTARLFGWVSYSYSVSKRRDGEGKDWYDYDYDQRHIATVVASYKLTQKWEAGFKWRLTSGAPETPIVGAIYDPVHQYYIPISGALNSVRKPAYHRLDLSVSRTSSHDTWQLRWYLEILNVYNSKNVIGYDYSTDYSTRKEIKQIPFLPYLGVEVRF
jgi:outer membrane receptor protein involved in Fe transport